MSIAKLIQESTHKLLSQLYWGKNLSLKEISEIFNVSIPTIFRWMKKYDIPRRTTGEALEKYFQTPKSILHKNKIANSGRKQKIVISYEELFDLYISQNKSSMQIAQQLKCSASTVLNLLKENNIPRRTKSEAKVGKHNPNFGKIKENAPNWGRRHTVETKEKIKNNVPKGEQHFRWKSPEKRISTLDRQIRSSTKMKQWRIAVFQRDNHTCVFCGSKQNKSIKINADHIVPVVEIKEKYKITSLEQALDCDFLWQVDNGRTLCEQCHRATDTWGNNKNKRKTK